MDTRIIGSYEPFLITVHDPTSIDIFVMTDEVISYIRILLQEVIITQIIKNSPPYMEPEVSLPFPKKFCL
jgi:hypothetical protein